MTDDLVALLQMLLSANDETGEFHLLPIAWEDRIKPLVWEWEASESGRQEVTRG